MDRLELGVDQRDAQQRSQRVLAVEVALQIAQQVRHPLRWRRHEHRVAGTAAADPVLRAAQLPGLLAGAAHALHQDTMAVVEQTHGDRRALRRADLLEGLFDGRDGVCDLLDVLDAGVAGLVGLLPGQHVDERRLRALDLAGQ